MKTYVADTLRNGKGVFGVKDIKRGEIIGCFEGRIYNVTQISKLDENYLLGIGENKWIYVTSSLRHTNHSCNPNSIVKNRLKLVALKNIKKNEEITFDYALTEEDHNWKMNCNCGEEKCREVIVGTAKFQEKF